MAATAGLAAPVPPLPPLPVPRLAPLALDDDGPDDPARARRLEWSKLLKRAWAFDVLTCPRCAGSMRLIAFIQDGRTARKILAHLGLLSRVPTRAPPGPVEQTMVDLDGVDPPSLVD